MAFYHGIKTSQKETSVSTPIEAGCGIPFVVGTAPVHTVGGKVNVPVLVTSWAEAVAALGYSDDWEKYTLCEMMYSHFRLYGMQPCVFVNVLNPEDTDAVEEVTGEVTNVVNRSADLPYEAILTTLSVSATESGEALKEGTDWSAAYTDGVLRVELSRSGAAADAKTIYVTYSKIKPDVVTKDDIIGGYDASTGVYSGMETLDMVYPMYGIIPDLLLAPGYSHDSEVAAIMSAKAISQGELFEAKALIDVDASTVKKYSDVLAWKKDQNIMAKYQVLGWPMVKLGEKIFHYSVALAGVIAQTDANNDACPSDSPSNKALQADALVDADGNEIVLTLPQANYLNSVGVCTSFALNGGLKIWGNYTACYPENTDVKDQFIPVSRTFAWVANSLILTFWSKVDRPMNRMLVDNVTDSCNMWISSLAAEGKIIAGRVEAREDENPTIDLLQGKIKFHVFLTCTIPAQELEFVLEYDPDKLANIFA